MKQEAGKSQLVWWLIWICATIGSFFLAAFFWTGIIAARVGPMTKPGAPVLWVVAVFGTWMLFLIPLIVVMYRKVDKAYEDARIRREAARTKLEASPPPFRTAHLEPSRRMLVKPLRKKLAGMPPAIRGGHLVTAILRDGRRIDHVFVADRKEMLGVYDHERPTFDASDIVDVVAADLECLPDFLPGRWLRLDWEKTVP